MSTSVSSAFREITAERVDEYAAMGHRRKHFFPHRIYHLPKCGPDGLRLASHIWGKDDPAMMWELVLFAGPPVLAKFPDELFFDDDLIWHRQQFGRPGQVATVNIALDDGIVYTTGQLADVAQRISRRREYKTKVSKYFRGWTRMLLNAVVGFAEEQGAHHVRTPTARVAMWNTDVRRRAGLGPALFERAYDRTATELFAAQQDGEGWSIDVAGARDRLLRPERKTESHLSPKTICICHDVERGMGHTEVDPPFAEQAEQTSPGDLERMRAIEAELGVRATYSVVGSLMPELKTGLRAEGHALAFHSFDHRLDREKQLDRCRDVDYRINGYRPPNSVITPELSDRNLLYRNFEWIASGARSLGVSAPQLRDRLVRLPIALDDFPMHDTGMPYDQWERNALDAISGSDFTAIGLHDCYAPHWLPHYRGFLERLGEIGELRTLDDVASEVTLCSAA